MLKRIWYAPLLFAHCFVTFGQHDVTEIGAFFLDATSPIVLVASHCAAYQKVPKHSLLPIQQAINLEKIYQ